MNKGRFPLCSSELGVKNILPKCSESMKWSAILLSKKWLIMTYELAYEKILSCSNSWLVVDLGSKGAELNIRGLIRRKVRK